MLLFVCRWGVTIKMSLSKMRGTILNYALLTLLLLLQGSAGQIKSFMLSASRANYTTALAQCEEWGLRFATILTQGQNLDFRFFSEVSSKQVILVSGRNTTGWTWNPKADISFPMTFFDWKDNQPFSGFECLAVRGSATEYGWYSVPCSSEYFFACESISKIIS